MSRVYNFSAGPAVLPEEVLKEAADEMLDYRGTGMSVMEMSHRSKAFETIIQEAEADLRELMDIPANYKVLFLQGGASQQFAMIPMNLMKNRVADYIVTGQWAKKAADEAGSHLLQTRLFLIFRTVRIFRFQKMQIMYTSVRIIRFTEQNLKNCRIQKERRWLQTFLPVSSLSL